MASHSEPRWVSILLILCVVWAGGLAYFGYHQLRDTPVVHGLFRGYAPPYERDGSWVIDPRKTRLVDELRARYGRGNEWQPPAPEGIDGWRALADTLQLDPVPLVQGAPLSAPSLIFTTPNAAPLLFILHDGEHYLFFEDGVGVITLPEPPTYQSGYRLDAAENRAW